MDRDAPKPIDRRTFHAMTLAAAAGAALPGLRAAGAEPDARPASLRHAVKYEMVAYDGSVLDKFRLLKRLGYDGVEIASPNELDQQEVIDARDETGLKIHGTVCSTHWRLPLSHPDADVRRQAIAGVERAMHDCVAYGGNTVLVVPAVVNAEVSYADAYERSQAAIRRLIPLAEHLGVRMAIENVWNHFLLSPLEAARYVDEFESDAVGWYFDIGNIVNYGWPTHWIRTLGDRILKLDIKDFSRKKRDEEGLWRGFAVEIGEGDSDWPGVMKALAEIGYSGWATAEVRGGGEDRLQEIKRRMDSVLR
ncbi:MAG: sugar phosphate isomerase/epimerase [Phycisphaerales bacterium]|nr:sugar phosphate isomerase/epimerase [Phycisphaerales bacterium]